ncbi:MAG: hypothetical protein A2V77_23275 [Anaeromyxobacter sp. RBG_16_69_14]|nr:MAG: hypothetical protein A2V77_23275 [Anaeromyxobacter sp. RBG_16_69_14]
MSQTVLDKLHDVVLDNRQRRDDRPREKGRQVLVDPSGRIVIGDAVQDDERPQLSEVHQAVFAAGQG